MSDMEIIVHTAHRAYSSEGKMSYLSYWAYQLVAGTNMADYANIPNYPASVPGAEIPETSAKVGDDGKKIYCAWRRFRDFHWLRKQLVATNPGVIVPPVPAKTEGTTDKLKDLMNKDADSIEENVLAGTRKRQLGLFVAEVANHPQLVQSKLLFHFLTDTHSQWKAYQKEADVVEKLAQAGVKSSWMEKLVNVVAKVEVPATFPPGSQGAVTRQIEHNLGNALQLASDQMELMVKESRTPLPVNHVPKLSCTMALCEPMVHLHARVFDNEGKFGQVAGTNEEGSTLVLWKGDDQPKASRVLYAPPDGITDPVVAATQNANFCVAEFWKNQATDVADELSMIADELCFLSRWAQAAHAVLGKAEEEDKERRQLEIRVQKEKKDESRDRMRKKILNLEENFQKRMEVFEKDYPVYVKKRRVLEHRVAERYGEAMKKHLHGDWAERFENVFRYVDTD